MSFAACFATWGISNRPTTKSPTVIAAEMVVVKISVYFRGRQGPGTVGACSPDLQCIASHIRFLRGRQGPGTVGACSPGSQCIASHYTSFIT